MLSLFLFFMAEPSLTTVWSRPLEQEGLFRLRDRAIIAVSTAGRILLADSDEPRLLLFNGDGELWKGLGKRGSGPGEFTQPSAVGWSPNHKVFQVFDYRGQRLSWFDEDGRFLRDFKPPEFVRNPVFAGDRMLYTLRAGDAGRQYRALMSWTAGEEASQEKFRHPMPAGPILEWTPILTYAAGSRFQVVNHGHEPQLYIIDGAGKARTSVTIGVPRVPLTDTYFNQRQAELRSNPKFASMGLTLKQPEHWPWCQNILVDEQDRIWVFLHREQAAKPRAYFIYNLQNQLLGSGTIGGDAQIFSGSYLYMIRHGQDEELFLEKIDITNIQ